MANADEHTMLQPQEKTVSCGEAELSLRQREGEEEKSRQRLEYMYLRTVQKGGGKEEMKNMLQLMS